MDCPEAKRGEVAVACPPDDSLVEIFSRLHAKPLFRFKCISKDWCGLITDRLRCRKFPQTLEGFFAGKGGESYGGFIDLSWRPVSLVDPSFSFLTKSPEIKKIVLLDSCNGLVLFGHWRVSGIYDMLGYIVCNPAIEEWVSVPNPIYTNNPGEWDDEEYQVDCPDTHTYLIFDPAISPHFQLIHFRFGCRFELDEVHAFSSVTGSWRLVEGVPHHIMLDTIGLCLSNDMLHFGAEHQPWRPPENKHMILAVGGEERPCDK